MKNFLYKKLFNNIKELQEAATYFLAYEDIKISLKKIYWKRIEYVFKLSIEHMDDNLDKINNGENSDKYWKLKNVTNIRVIMI